jgi:DNA repair exonuclease SbcCD ATPase subunit
MQIHSLEHSLEERDEQIAAQQQQLQDLQSDLEEQLALHDDLAVKLEEQHKSAQQEIEGLKATMAGHSLKDTVGFAAAAQDSCQLYNAEQAVEELSAEKVQLLEAYQLLEEDTGRLIDEAASKEASNKQQLIADLKVLRISSSRRLGYSLL